MQGVIPVVAIIDVDIGGDVVLMRAPIVSETQQRGSYFVCSRFFYRLLRSAAIDNGR
jgi:hypothetical protein